MWKLDVVCKKSPTRSTLWLAIFTLHTTALAGRLQLPGLNHHEHLTKQLDNLDVHTFLSKNLSQTVSETAEHKACLWSVQKIKSEIMTTQLPMNASIRQINHVYLRHKHHTLLLLKPIFNKPDKSAIANNWTACAITMRQICYHWKCHFTKRTLNSSKFKVVYDNNMAEKEIILSL